MATQTALRLTLPGLYYTDPQVYADELEHFFFQHWVCVGRAERIREPGDFFVCEIGGESVIVTRDQQERVRAFFNVCRHRGTRLCTEAEGRFEGRIQCGYHGWSYGLDGALLGAPHMEGAAGFCRQDFPLHRVHVDTWAGHIFVNLSRNPVPLRSQLADLPEKFAPWRMEELSMSRRIVYDVRANWKLIILNYSECLHCPILHPLLNQWTDYLSGDNEPANESYMGGSMLFKAGAETMSVDGRRRRDYLPGLGEQERTHVYYYAVFPNLLLSAHPDYVMTHTLWPRAVDRTEIVCELHFHPAEMSKPGFTDQDVAEFWDITNREDWRVSELAQAGISSRAYTPGPFSPREGLLYAFEQMVMRRTRKSGS